MLHHYCVYTRDPHYVRVLDLLRSHAVPVDLHLNRYRFWLDSDHTLHTLIALCCKCIDSETNHALGI